MQAQSRFFSRYFAIFMASFLVGVVVWIAIYCGFLLDFGRFGVFCIVFPFFVCKRGVFLRYISRFLVICHIEFCKKPKPYKNIDCHDFCDFIYNKVAKSSNDSNIF